MDATFDVSSILSTVLFLATNAFVLSWTRHISSSDRVQSDNDGGAGTHAQGAASGLPGIYMDENTPAYVRLIGNTPLIRLNSISDRLGMDMHIYVIIIHVNSLMS